MRRRPWIAAWLASLTLAAVPAFAEPPVWVVRSPRASIVLFGSVHLLPSGLAWRPRALDSALARADELWFELPVDDATEAEAARLARARGMLPASDQLSNHLTAEQNERLARVAGMFHISMATLAPMRPWLAEVTISLFADTAEGALAAQGVEQQIQATTPARLRRRALETPAQQVGFLADEPIADQVASLDETLHEIADEPNTYRRLVGEWLAGDLAGLRTDALDRAMREAPGEYRRLITERNRRWARIIRRRLRRGGDTVIVVGVAHLVGPGGVPALLRAQGFDVEGP
jgi:uncharacterized protein YbaP (TraB family)